MLKAQIRSGAYYDSVVLMQLQRSLAAMPGVEDAGVVMGVAANKDVLAQSGLLSAEAQAAGADDLVIVVRAADSAAADAALAQVDALLTRRSAGSRSRLPPQELGRSRADAAGSCLGCSSPRRAATPRAWPKRRCA
jgi:FdrA protein